MEDVPVRVLEYLTEVEEAAEDVLTTKQQIVDLDTKRNSNREALNALKNEMSDTGEPILCDRRLSEKRKVVFWLRCDQPFTWAQFGETIRVVILQCRVGCDNGHCCHPQIR
uniref:P53 and DNA-damage regulated 1 n=1 Tax=Gasterosteus aculeatus TaxID=69293 RepID=G3PBA0_GASAC